MLGDFKLPTKASPYPISPPCNILIFVCLFCGDTTGSPQGIFRLCIQELPLAGWGGPCGLQGLNPSWPYAKHITYSYDVTPAHILILRKPYQRTMFLSILAWSSLSVSKRKTFVKYKHKCKLVKAWTLEHCMAEKNSNKIKHQAHCFLAVLFSTSRETQSEMGNFLEMTKKQSKHSFLMKQL